MNTKKIIVCVGLLASLSLITTGCGKTAKLKTEKTTVVSLKSSKITADDLYKQLKKDSIQKLVNMIDKKLFDKKYTVSDSEEETINTQIKKIKSYYKNDEDSFKSAIKTYYGVDSESELRENFELDYKRSLAVNDYLKDNLTDTEIQKYYDENIYGDIKASHILISIDTKSSMTDDEKKAAKSKALDKANKIIEKLNAGEKFSDLAKKYSTDSDTASNGGNLGYVNSDSIDASFWNALKNLDTNKYTTEAVETSYGYDIIMKTGEKKKKTLKSVKTTIQTALVKQKLSNDSTLYYKTLMNIRTDKKMTFGDSYLEKLYNDYMDKLIDNAKNNSSSSTSTN